MNAVTAPTTRTQPLADDLAMALDPVVFAKRAGMVPDRWQATVLRSRHRRILLNCSRQSGKSSTTAIVALHEATYAPGSLILLLSPGLRQSAELFRKVADAYEVIGETVPSIAETTQKLELANGSRIVSLPGSERTIRGLSAVSLLVIDEASRVPDDLYASVRPMLAVSNGRLIAMSTPWGKRGWFSDAWHDGGDAWQRVKITAEACPRISSAFLEEERRALGDWMYRQEYACDFVDASSSAFRSADIEAATSGEVVETWSI